MLIRSSASTCKSLLRDVAQLQPWAGLTFADPAGQLLSPFGATEQPGFGAPSSSAFGAANLGPFSFGPGQDGVTTRASELLGVPSLAMGFTAKVLACLLSACTLLSCSKVIGQNSIATCASDQLGMPSLAMCFIAKVPACLHVHVLLSCLDEPLQVWNRPRWRQNARFRAPWGALAGHGLHCLHCQGGRLHAWAVRDF